MIHIRTNELLQIIVQSDHESGVTDEVKERCTALLDQDVNIMLVGVKRLSESPVGTGQFANIMATALNIAVEEMEFARDNVIQLDVSAND